ncbi:MAG TPA: glucose-6-phosphate dehydrogenase assembly protein OpcA [Acidimicrobiales bacterium]|nr:glucose-6-phosphate dehydrogenase assembly protein OpcA [Acidimicrobiales bacterium]
MTEGLIGSWSSEDSSLPEVLGRLERLRREADRTASRAAVVNLVVVAAVDAAADRVVASVAGLGAHHPGRIVVLVPESPAGPDGSTGTAGAAPELAARIELRESDATGRRLWWEVVLLRARGPVCGHLESLMQPLLLHDLPVALWLAGGASTVDSPAVVAGAHHVIVSGERAAATGRSSVADDLAALAARRPLADLAWLAIEPARRAVARLFDPPERRAGLSGASVAVTGPPWSSRLLAAWLVERAGIDPRLVTLGADPEGAGRLRAEIDLEGRAAVVDAGAVWPAGAGGSAGPGAARAWLGPATVVVPHGGSDTPTLLAAALTHPGRDPRYEAALAVAAGMF